MTWRSPTLPRFCALNNAYTVFCDLDPSFVGNETLWLRSSCLPASLKSLLACGGGPGTGSELGIAHCGLVREWCEPKRESHLCCDCSNGLWKWAMWGGRGTEWDCSHYLDMHIFMQAVAFFFHDLSDWVWMSPFLFFPSQFFVHFVDQNVVGGGCQWPRTMQVTIFGDPTIRLLCHL